MKGGTMKVTVEITLEIEGEVSKAFVRDKFIEWFEIAKWKISPDEEDDNYQVWVRSMEVIP